MAASRPGGSRPVSTPSDALTAFANASIAQAKQAEQGQPDRRVSVAFALGWQMAEVYRPSRRDPDRSASMDDLPGISSLTPAELAELGLDQVQAGITKLALTITDAGLELPDAEAFGHGIGTDLDRTERQVRIRSFHVALLSTLTAADFRLGKAYGLGRAMADTTRSPPDFEHELREGRMAQLTTWVRELASALPPHAAHPVASSMDAWSREVAGGSAEPDKLKAELGAQGRLWRSLLSGEKRAVDVLETSDYLRAGEGMLKRSGALAWSFLVRAWWIVAIVLFLFGFGIAAVTTSGNALAVGAGAVGLLTSLGVTWRGIGTSLATVTSHLEQPIWQAEVDRVIYQRITPQEIVDHQGDPAPGADEPSLTAAGQAAARAATEKGSTNSN
jgi:hypothetical protein